MTDPKLAEILPLRLHIGCGQVYLKDFCNVDVRTKGHYLVSERPDLVEKNITTVDNYYKRDLGRDGFVSGTYQGGEVVVDKFAFADKLPFRNKSVDEIRCYQVLEHFDLHEVSRILRHWRLKLKVGGILYIDIPDLEQTAWEYLHAETPQDKDWYVHLLYGSHKNKYGVHKMMYSRASIARLLYLNEFDDFKYFPNIHLNKDGSVLYPAFAIQAIKQ